MDISVREAVAEDAQQICDVHLSSIEELGKQSYTQEQVAAWAHGRDPEEYPIESEDTYFVVAEDVTDVVGFGWMKPEAGEYLQTEVEGEITAIYIHPSAARNGVGSRIYGELERKALQQDIESIGMWASRNAVLFYEAQGYEQVGEHSYEFDLLLRVNAEESHHGISGRAKRPVDFKTHTFQASSAGFQHRLGCL
ncbi:GNAT family N-acetyltransferase, partial [Halorubrum ezzemoulense]|uniref:GNAT family N-acetyltransferase n=1 Tax=Halorubrum ezzemoulense TaxID=337243 RepID=UPI00232BE86E